MTTSTDKNSIDRTLFAVKAFDASIQSYCLEYLTRELTTAKQLAALARAGLIESGRPPRVKIVFPRKLEVEFYLLLGNKIR